jgi:predicted Zn-dependent protease
MPTNGQLHFDDDENWVFMDINKLKQFESQSLAMLHSRYEYVDLLAVAVHEIGHVLGLSHSVQETSIMTPQYHRTVDDKGNYKAPSLDRLDTREIQEMYGK